MRRSSLDLSLFFHDQFTCFLVASPFLSSVCPLSPTASPRGSRPHVFLHFIFCTCFLWPHVFLAVHFIFFFFAPAFSEAASPKLLFCSAFPPRPVLFDVCVFFFLFVSSPHFSLGGLFFRPASVCDHIPIPIFAPCPFLSSSASLPLLLRLHSTEFSEHDGTGAVADCSSAGPTADVRTDGSSVLRSISSVVSRVSQCLLSCDVPTDRPFSFF